MNLSQLLAGTQIRYHTLTVFLSGELAVIDYLYLQPLCMVIASIYAENINRLGA